ncbi:MAG: ABC transporter permease [Thermaurantimonas sp.]|uniref:ABC transporter permease n=1 Tax=Thermaurantimonas sp. TaxID=2681568 RepID=UPI00391AF80C
MIHRRNRHNPLKSLPAFFIGVFVFIALLSFLLPTEGPGAYDHIQLEYALKPPFVRVQYVKLNKSANAAQATQYYPADSIVKISNDSLIIYYRNKSAYVAHKEDDRYILEQKTFYLGTDRFGRDMWARIAYGSRVSLSIGFLAMIVSLSVGIPLGAVAGYMGGAVDKCIMWLATVVWSVPSVLLVMSFTLVFGKSLAQVFVAVGLTMWVDVARTVRGRVMSIRHKEYILAAQIGGLSTWRILSVHIFPNILGPILILAASNFSTAVLLESGISFLGLGVQPPTPSWGNIIRDHYAYLLMGKPWTVLFPALCIIGLILSLISLANCLRDYYDVKGE